MLPKFKVILIATLLCSFLTYAQLYVRNDNYVFVNDQIIFVEDNIGIQEADSKIYLRDEAQLIQGTGTTGNSGLGQLSIYQTGTVHQYAYNYWCSPIGNNSLSLGNENFLFTLLDEPTGLITSLDAEFTDNLDGFTSPLTISNEWLYTFENSEVYAQWTYQGETGSITPGLGFTMKGVVGGNQTYDFRGKPNNGTITNSVLENIWTLVGNPYPSAVDTVEFIHDPDNVNAINGVLYFWEQDLSVLSHVLANYVGGYALYTISLDGLVETYIHAPFNTYNSDGTLNVAGSPRTSGKNLGRYIPIAQGFMVQGELATTGTVSMKNEHRVYQKESISNGQFFRNSSNNESTETEEFFVLPSDYKRFRLNVDFDDTYTRQLVQTFHDTESTEDFDYGLDIPHSFSLNHDAYWMSNSDNRYYTAKAQPLDIESTVLPLDMYLGSEQNLRFRITDIQNFDSNQPIYLHDKLTGTFTNLRNEHFEIMLNADYYVARFEIVFTSSVLSDDNFLYEDFDIRHNIANHQLQIYDFTSAIEKIEIFDMIGKEVFTINNLGQKNIHTIDTEFLSPGIYIAKIEGTNGELVSKKFITNK